MPLESPEKPPFLPIVGYVLGFMAVLAILAFVVAMLLRMIR
jgi:F0F1-type ATP synthase membrane subunit c/vacuolar-type H+-ATPase subunit K